LMVRALAALERGDLKGTPQQSEGLTYAAKIDKAEAHINFARPTADVHNHIRALSPFPGAWFEANGERIKVLRSAVELHGIQVEPGTVIRSGESLQVACTDGAVSLIELQRAGKKPIRSQDFLRGFTLQNGTRIA
jgi:methionyl-tRNA formyltransferase